MMTRRELIAYFGCAALISPHAVFAQSVRMRHIGVLVGLASAEDDPVAGEFLRPFRDAMLQAGWAEGKDIRVDYKFGRGDFSKTDAAAAELVALDPELIFTQGLLATLAVAERTKSIPIVFTQVADPVGFGLANSLAHPGGNVTGFMVWDLSIGGKWMQLLRQIVPGLNRVGVIYNPDTARYAPPLIEAAKTAAGQDVAVIECPSHNDREIEVAISSLGNETHSGLIIIPEPLTVAHRDQIVALAARHRLPAINSVPGATEQGALMSYTVNFEEIIRLPVPYIGRILKGESPGNLPVQAPTRYELALNAKTAKSLGLDIPPLLLALADKVIE